MPKARKRKVPIVQTDTLSTSSSTPQSSRKIIRRFHVLQKRRTQFLNSRPDVRAAQDLSIIDQEIEELGGLKCYQRMSVVGQGVDRGGGSEKILINWLQEIYLAKGHRLTKPSLRLLEVGALKPDNYKSCSEWIHCTPIDLRSRHPSIVEQDFFLMDEVENHEKWDVISLSLVLNFVPDPKGRGNMLRLAHSMLVPGGYLFLTLPLACVTNSRYLNFTRLKKLMDVVGLVERREKWKKDGKMGYWLYQKHDRPDESLEPFQKKTNLRQGSRNNFCILLTS